MRHRYPTPTPPALGSPLDQARAAFDWLTRGPHPVTVNGRSYAGLPGRAVRLDELRDRLHDRRCPGATRDAVWAWLVHRARVEAGVWTIACVGCALPALTTTSRQLCRALPAAAAPPPHARRTAVAGVPPHPHRDSVAADGGRPHHPPVAPGDRPHLPAKQEMLNQEMLRHAGSVRAVGDVEAAVLSGFVAELAVIDPARGQVLGRLRSAAHEAGVLARRDLERAPIPRAHLFTSCPPPLARHPDLVLARAVTAGAITRNEAALIGSTRLEPISLAQVAVLRGQSYRDVRAARIRAERKLATFLREQDTGSIDTFLRAPGK